MIERPHCVDDLLNTNVGERQHGDTEYSAP